MPGSAAPSFALAFALLLSGCAGLIGGKQPVSVGAASRPLPLPITPGPGSFNVQKGRPGYVIGVPHGSTDIATGRGQQSEREDTSGCRRDEE